MNELIGGNVPAAVDAIADLTEQHRAGKITILASSGAKRSTAVPDVPTFTELGIKGGEAKAGSVSSHRRRRRRRSSIS